MHARESVRIVKNGKPGGSTANLQNRAVSVPSRANAQRATRTMGSSTMRRDKMGQRIPCQTIQRSPARRVASTVEARVRSKTMSREPDDRIEGYSLQEF